MLKGIWLSKEVLIFEEMVHLLREICVTDKENSMISYTGDDDSDKCFPLVYNIMYWVSKEQIFVSLYFDEDEYTIIQSCCMKLLWVKNMLKECNVIQDVMTFVYNIFTKPLDIVHFEKGI